MDPAPRLEDSMQLAASHAGGALLAGRIDKVGVVILNQPHKLNAISMEMWGGIADALDLFEADPEVRVVVYAGAGGKAFASGADISQFAARRGSAEANAEYARVTDRGRLKLATFPKPGIACIQGFCLGGGLAIAIQTDLRVAAAESQFGVPAARLGLSYGMAATDRLVSLVGPARARLLLYTGSRFSAAEALAMGLVDKVVPANDLVRATLDLARTIAGNAPLSVQAAKFTVAEAMKPAGERDTAAIEAHGRRCMDSADYLEGRTAFLEKRKAVFTGT